MSAGFGRAVRIGVGYLVGVYTGNWAYLAGVLEGERQRIQADKARRRAIQAYNDSLVDRLEMIERNPRQARTLAYGRVRAVEGVRRDWETGTHSENLTLAVSFAGHEIDAFESWYLNDQAVTLDGSGWVNEAPYRSTRQLPGSDSGALDGSGNATITLSLTPTAGTIVATWYTGAGGSRVEGSASVSVVGTTATVTGGQALATAVVVYTYGDDTKRARVRSYLGTAAQNIGSALAAEYPGKITASDKAAGVAMAIVDLVYDTDVFPTGRPNVTAVFRGKKLYDPRKDSTVSGGSGSHRLATASTWEWSENPALVAYDYARHANGWAVPAAEINTADVMAAANACDVSTGFVLSQPDSTLVLGLNFEGNFTDVSAYAHTATVSGTTTSTAQAKAGTSAGLWNATGQSLSYTAAAEWLFGTSDFTLQAWVYPTSVDATRRSLFDFRFDGSGSGTSWALDYTSGDTRFQVGIGATLYTASWGSALTVNTWQHVAAVREGATLRLYVGGVQRATAAATTGAVNGSSSGSKPFLGRRNDATQNFGGYMDLVQVNAACQYPGGTTFTPAASALTGNADSTVTLPRYRCGITIPTDADPLQAMDDILATMAGRLAWAGGVLRMRAGTLASTAFAMTDIWLVEKLQAGGAPDGEPIISAAQSVARPQRWNRISGTCVDPDQRYQMLPFPAVEDATLIAAKGEREREMQLPGVSHIAHAQHLASMAIRQAQAGQRIELRCGLKALDAELLDVFSLTYQASRHAISAKLYEVIGWRWAPDDCIRVQAAEISAALFTVDASLDGRDPAPDSGLREPWEVEALAGLAVTSGTTAVIDGSVLTRTTVSWTAAAGQSVRQGGEVEVQYTPAADTVPAGDAWPSWVEAGTSTQAVIPGLLAGRYYLFRVRAVQKLPLVRGAWSAVVRHKVAVPELIDTPQIAPGAATQVFTDSSGFKSTATILSDTGITVNDPSGLYSPAEFTLDGSYQCLVTVTYRLATTFGSAAQGYSFVGINKDTDATDYGGRTWTRTVVSGMEIDEAYMVTADFTLGAGQHVVGIRYTGKSSAHSPSYSSVPPQDVYTKVEVIRR